MPWGALAAGIAATASTIGSSQQAGAAKDAAGMQEDAANLARADQLALMRQQRQDSAPYRESGYNALAKLNYLMGLGSPTTTAKTRDYFDAEKYKQWRIQKMTEAVNKLYPNNPDKAARIIARKTEKIGATYLMKASHGLITKNGQPQRLQKHQGSSGKHAMQEQQQVAARILVFCNSGLTVHCLKKIRDTSSAWMKEIRQCKVLLPRREGCYPVQR